MSRIFATAPVLPDGRLPETGAGILTIDDPEALQQRVNDLETLCAEVYVAAVELGFPQTLLNRLWTVAAHGRVPHAFDIEMPPRPVAPSADASSTAPGTLGAASTTTPPTVEPMQIPDIRLTDRSFAARSGESGTQPALPELKPLATRSLVMVVDDDPMMLDVLGRILQRENYELVTCTSGPEALRRAETQEGPIDLLITDYAMPEMKGRELAEKMRDRYQGLRVLYQTGFSDMLFENRIELEDGSAFLEKPFTARGLREAARFILFGQINPA